MPPLLTFKRSFDATITVGDTVIPIHAARVDKLQLEELDEGWRHFVAAPEGSTPRPAKDAPVADLEVYVRAENARIEEWNKSVALDRMKFFEEMIPRYITLDEGVIEDSGVSVVDGQGLLRIFHGRRDVLRDLVGEVIACNHLTAVMRKNSPSPRGSGTGSAPSIQARGGDKPEPTAGSVDNSSTAAAEPATDKSSSPAAVSDETNEGTESSGEKVH